MTRRRLLAAVVLLASAIAFVPRAATVNAAQWSSGAKATAPEYGPPNGALVIGGGSSVGLPSTIIDRFIALGGGVEGKFVIVPTANGNLDRIGNEKKPHVYVESAMLGPWLNRGLKHVKMLHTHDPRLADTVEFAKVLSDATAVWFTGGRHHHIVDSYAGTLTYREFHKVLERGGVIGGSSAGATIQGEYLVRGDSRTNTIVMTDERNHQRGFEFLRRSAIDQHIDARSRWDDLIPVIRRFPNLLGIGLSEDTAIVVKGDQFEVMGKSQVAIHDNTRHYQRGEKPYYLLGAGDVYNMRTRQVVTHAEVPSSPSTSTSASASAPTGTARPQSSPASAPPPDSPQVAAPSGTTMTTMGTGKGSDAVPAPIPAKLTRLLELLLIIAGENESWRHIEVIDVDADGEIDLLRIHLINGETIVWELETTSGVVSTGKGNSSFPQRL